MPRTSLCHVSVGHVSVAKVMLALVLAGCSPGGPDPGPPASPPPDGPVISDPVGLARFTIDPDPLWGNQEVPLHPEDVILAGDLAVVIGNRSEDFPELHVVDAGTGKERWSLQPAKQIPGFEGSYLPDPGAGSGGVALVGRPGHELLVVEYYHSDCLTEPCPPDERSSPESGVVALDLRTGTPRWHHAAIGSIDEQADPDGADRARHQTLSVIGGRAARPPMIVVGPVVALNGQEAVDPDQVRTDALDPDSGRRVWSSPQFAATVADADTVIGFGPTPGPNGRLSVGHGPVAALDLGTGRQRWNLAGELPDATVTAQGPGSLVLRARISPKAKLVVVNVSDGSVDHDLGTTVAGSLAVAGQDGLVVYRDGLEHHDRLQSIVAGEEQPARSGLPITGDPTLVHNGYVFLHDTAADTTVVDRAGTVLSDPLPGRVIAVSEDWVVLQRGFGRESTFTVHAR